MLDSPRAGNITTVSKTRIAPAFVLRARCPVVVMPQLERGPSLLTSGR
ncbi:MAG: hypothetical protein ABJA87_06810 [bacterium]